MLVSHSINLTKQIFDLIIFESNNLPQAIELNWEDFLLILLVAF